MDLRHLRYFVTVAETLNFGRAAKRLHISQPPLSRQIAALEAELGTRLFERTRRAVKLSTAGAALLPEARRLLREADGLKERARHFAAGRAGTLALGFLSMSAYNVLPALLPAFHRAHPGVRLALQENTSDVQLAALALGEIDVGLVLPPVSDPALEYVPLHHEPLVAALPAKRRWQRSAPLALGDLAGEPFIMFPPKVAPGLYDLVVAFCRRGGFAPRIEQEAIQMQTIVSLVAAGMGVALVPASLTHLRRTGVVYRQLAETSPPVEVGMTWRSGDDSPLVAAFVGMAQAVASRAPHEKPR